MTNLNPYSTGDPVVDLAQGRPMIVLEAPEQTVAEWSEQNNYDLETNYANAKLDTQPDDYVVRCVYLSDIRSEPSKDYTFSASRVALIDAHHADGGRRLFDRVAVEVLEAIFAAYMTEGTERERETFERFAAKALGDGVVDEARELADVEQTIGGGDD